jgi:hypothetical protein
MPAPRTLSARTSPPWISSRVTNKLPNPAPISALRSNEPTKNRNVLNGAPWAGFNARVPLNLIIQAHHAWVIRFDALI